MGILNSTKHARVTENERALPRSNHQVIVATGCVSCRFNAQFTAHSQVKTEPVITGEMKHHLFGGSSGRNQALVHEPAAECERIGSPKNPRRRMDLHGEDPAAVSGELPSLPIKFNLGQLGHVGIYRNSQSYECDESIFAELAMT